MELPEKFTYPFSYAPHPLVREAAGLLVSRIDADPALHEIFAEGKMLGVLVATGQPEVACPDQPEVTFADRPDADPSAETVVLYAFSGNVTVTDADGTHRLTNHLEGFVPPIYDLLDPDGHFKAKEAEISELNHRIYKAEKTLRHGGQEPSEMKRRRKELSEYLQKWIFDQFVVLNARGESRSVTEIFADKGLIPPGGTGECALPKLLQYAYRKGLRPRCFGEFWYGRSSGREVRTQGSFYPSCTGKCGVLLPYMLQGLDVDADPLAADVAVQWHLEDNIIYEDEAIVAVNKASGMLSVPGRDKTSASLLELLQRRANDLAGATPHHGPKIFAVHRLDMDTSGIILYAKTAHAQSELRRQFEAGEVRKSYVARLAARSYAAGDGAASGAMSDAMSDAVSGAVSGAMSSAVSGAVSDAVRGTISLPLAADYFDRPRQIVDMEHGKAAVTDYEVLKTFDDGGLLVRLWPHTGRTHQLRVHCAHSEGLGHPIAGDRLYGGQTGDADCLCLMAEAVSFVHPESGEAMELRLEMPQWGE